ncbi:MAG: hypothetical protein HC769_37270 [Cyanobacteria bacterium CRU_2_1]|nr:hypothetical protein [Cyanobacteria bacterium RU_5_0]NJR63921.1 hypothetical protein [Cyanobacteria bacterium CRU_2_1]
MSRRNYRPSRQGMPRRIQDGGTRVMSENPPNGAETIELSLDLQQLSNK